MKKITIYTDGGSRGNPGIGGWGAYFMHEDGSTKSLKGSEKMTTNNRMELLAAINALKKCDEGSAVDLYTDSQYVKNGITTWIHGWKMRGWRTANKQAVKNQDLWQELDHETQLHTVQWHWVRGHAGNEGNEKADALANEAMDELG